MTPLCSVTWAEISCRDTSRGPGVEITAVSQTNLGGSIPAWVQSQGRRLAKSKFLGKGTLFLFRRPIIRIACLDVRTRFWIVPIYICHHLPTYCRLCKSRWPSLQSPNIIRVSFHGSYQLVTAFAASPFHLSSLPTMWSCSQPSHHAGNTSDMQRICKGYVMCFFPTSNSLPKVSISFAWLLARLLPWARCLGWDRVPKRLRLKAMESKWQVDGIEFKWL
jgi:hypothetical protein